MLRRYNKGIAILLLVTFAQQIFGPSTVWALTGGPSQPEVNSFEPVGTNQMVDLSTGDFNYNIPLMVVPGPNGGYPINLAYHAGIGMEQEASWVGLGWNINPGAITRNLRGVPDDFSGDKIKKKKNLKNTVTAGLSVQLDQFTNQDEEKFGYKVQEASTASASLKVYYNNYRGVGYRFSLSRTSFEKQVMVGDFCAHAGLGELSFDSNTGIGVVPGIGISGITSEREDKNRTRGYGVGFGLNTRQGFYGLKLHYRKRKKGKGFKNSSITFSNYTYVPGVDNTTKGTQVLMGLSLSQKQNLPKYLKNKAIRGESTVSWLVNKEKDFESFGGIYLQNQEHISDLDAVFGKEYNRIMDVNVSNEKPINKRSVNMGLPFMTTDIFNISGQGIGGTFRAHRNDIGRFFGPGNTASTTPILSSTELGIGAGPNATYYHIGTDVSSGVHRSYTGKWTGGSEQLEDRWDGGLTEHKTNFDFSESSELYPSHEAFYFKVVGEQTANDVNEWDNLQGEEPVAFDIGLKWMEPGLYPKPVVKNNSSNIGGKIEPRNRDAKRIKRLQNIEYKTKGELMNSEQYSQRTNHLYSASDIPGIDVGHKIDFDIIDGTDSDVDHHIHEYSILKPDGTRYTYGLPAYNTFQQENVFANRSGAQVDGISRYEDRDLVSFDTDDADISNDEGVDNYYSGTEIPPYVHSHLITEITSADYVDLKGDGLSEDDFGFYAKFNYLEVPNYKWRDPFYGANYVKGHYSNEHDDKATFQYGEKNLYYVRSIETKTHIAVFELGNRSDGVGANMGDIGQGRNQSEEDVLAGMSGRSQKYLKTITLYAKRDLVEGVENAVPLQKVHFDYSYELCKGVFNNRGGDGDSDHFQTPNEMGKLTLKKVYITYNGNDKGRLSPYEFDYGNNPDYSRLNTDRWGNYQTPTTSDGLYGNLINPYTRQDASYGGDRDENASAWCLNRINLPSGGAISIDYESDDYGYVQDQRAAQMIEIYGFSDVYTNSPVSGDSRLKLGKKNLRLWFHAEKLDGVTDLGLRDEIVKDYIEGLNEIYFKVFENLKKPFDLSDDVAEDYVAGYAKVVPGSYGADELLGNFGYIDLEKAKYKSVALNLFSAHPFRKAGWQYLRYERSDLFNDQGTYDSVVDGAGAALLSIPLTLAGALLETLSIVALGQYNKFSILGFCKTMSLTKKSFIRLNSPNHQKYGGGHRVKSIVLEDNWIEGDRKFGTEYLYENRDFKTSGVADYEPLIGGEENALKKPIWFNGNDQLINFQHQDLFLETPISEDVYPSARVVYGRVIQKRSGLNNPDLEVPQGTITVHEYYTAKDFPVKTDYTRLKQTKGFNFPLFVPFVGLTTVNNKGYSQGYSVVLNDMSGKLKTVSTYPYREGIVEGLPITEVKYRYHTDNKGNLNNMVNVLDDHGDKRKAIIGVEQDFTVYEAQNSSFSEVLGSEINTDTKVDMTVPAAPVPIIVPTFKPHADHSQAMYRGITTSKIIFKRGVLEEVEVFSDGSTVVTKNLLYDAETGEALLTSVNNEWDKPVYNYKYAAHWAYEGMAGAYKNYRMKLHFEGDAGHLWVKESNGGLDAEVNDNGYLIPGDEVVMDVDNDGITETYYMSGYTYPGSNKVDLQDKNGVSLAIPYGPGEPGVYGVVMRSGRRNLQAVKSGSVTALSLGFLNADPDLSGQFVLWNNTITGAHPQDGMEEAVYFDYNTVSNKPYEWRAKEYFVPNFYNCSTGDYENMRIQMYSLNEIQFGKGCKGSLTFTGVTPEDNDVIFPVTIMDETGAMVTSFSEQLVDFKIVSENRIDGLTESVEMLHIPSNTIYTADWNPGIGENAHDCWRYCGAADILHADAIEFSDDWGESYPYADLGELSVGGGILISEDGLNEYRYGKKGVWRVKKTYLYQVDRKQKSEIGNSNRSEIDKDGEYEPWEPYNWEQGFLNPKWDWVSEITRYSPFGYGLEEKSRLNPGEDNFENSIYSSQMYGYDNSVVIATSALASYFEFGYSGFEQKIEEHDLSNSGHINISAGTGTYDVSGEKSHTGTNSVKVLNGENLGFNSIPFDPESQLLQGIVGKEYVVSLWVNVEESGSEGVLSIDGNSVSTSNTRQIIDGWKKLEMKFVMPASSVLIDYSSIGKTYIDDVRIGPYDGGMMTYVYDRKNLWLVAELDGLNYATFYNYDSEGNLVQVKKETENGIVTVQTSRSNTINKID